MLKRRQQRQLIIRGTTHTPILLHLRPEREHPQDFFSTLLDRTQASLPMIPGRQNLVERRFAELTNKRLKHGVFTSVTILKRLRDRRS